MLTELEAFDRLSSVFGLAHAEALWLDSGCGDDMGATA
jgi:hypothetical protein